MTNPFNILNPNRSGDDLRMIVKRDYEHARVKFVMSRVGLTNRGYDFRKRAVRDFGDPRFSFDQFNQDFSSFPLWLTCDNLSDLPAPLHTLNTAVLPIWFKNFTHLPFMPHYEKLFDGLGEAKSQLKPMGMIFPRRGFKQGLVIHNGDMHQFVPRKSSCHVYLCGDKNSSRTLVVQPIMSLLDHLYNKGHGWKPAD